MIGAQEIYEKGKQGKSYSPNGLGKPLFRMVLFYDRNLKLSLNPFLDFLYF